jgi:hypothetical protein
VSIHFTRRDLTVDPILTHPTCIHHPSSARHVLSIHLEPTSISQLCWITINKHVRIPKLHRVSHTPRETQVTANNVSRLRAPKRSPGATPTQNYFDPLPSPGVETTSPSGQSNPGKKPLYLCQPFVKAALVKGSFKTIVAPPKYVDVNEWVAVNCELPGSIRVRSELIVVFDFYHNLNHFYGALTEFCTLQNCPTMSAGPT